jgi:signal transduction histidine kinase
MAFAPLRLPLRTAASVCAIAVAAFDVHLALVAPNEGVFILVVTGGAAFFFVLGLLLRREQDQRQHIAGLLAELEASREAEKASAALAERSRLAREMHDVLAHTLSGLVLQLDAARLLARSEGPPNGTATLGVTLDRAHALARNGLAEARQAITALRGDQLPGPELLPDLVDEHRRTSTGTCRLTVTGEPQLLPPDARLAVYRTAQEALSNVRKHAPGADVDVRLRWAPGEAVLVVEDRDGHPPTAPDRSASGYGLTGMAERAQLLGGGLSAGPIESGFRVALRVPLRRAP